jgi:hypothetical protein
VKPLRALLHREAIPDHEGWLGFGILAAALLGHLAVHPDADGYLFRGLLTGAPSFLRGPLLDAAFEATAQAFLLVAPALALYAGLRHLLTRSDSLLPYLTVAGGGILSVITGCALAAAAL